MRNANKDNKPSHITKGDIFDDLGFSPADTLEAKIKADIWQALVQHIEKREFSQAYLVNTLEVHQPDVSNLLRGKISKISITKLIQFAAKLNLNARMDITERSASGAKAGKRSLTLA
jgi:predicted XRE-type DNA-binding protein